VSKSCYHLQQHCQQEHDFFTATTESTEHHTEVFGVNKAGSASLADHGKVSMVNNPSPYPNVGGAGEQGVAGSVPMAAVEPFWLHHVAAPHSSSAT
jgi:hypothetical protein